MATAASSLNAAAAPSTSAPRSCPGQRDQPHLMLLRDLGT